jgi:molybdopterin molybdotransferase
MRPGKPQACARTAAGVPVIAVPGNPVSAAVSFAVFVRPVLQRLAGLPAPQAAAAVAAPAASAWESPAGLRHYVPVRLEAPPGAKSAPWAEPVLPGAAGSHRVAALARASALAVVPEPVTQVRPGDRLALADLP